jgi:hypothetical protein
MSPQTREGAGLKAGAVLVRERKGRLERVTVLEEGFTTEPSSAFGLRPLRALGVESRCHVGPFRRGLGHGALAEIQRDEQHLAKPSQERQWPFPIRRKETGETPAILAKAREKFAGSP